MFTEVITLLKEIETTDDYGDIVRTYSEREIFARLDRVYLREAIEGEVKGLKPEKRFRIADYYDYDDEEELVFDGKKYNIINTQRIGTELEINCTGGVVYG